jgi:hypothetical protein
MRYYLLLSNHFYGCPLSWRGFIDSLGDIELPEKDEDGSYTTDFIDTYLNPYHAKYIESDNEPDFVVFETEADAIVFKLKYGGNS